MFKDIKKIKYENGDPFFVVAYLWIDFFLIYNDLEVLC
jgi:hypothetical protein